MSEINYHNKSFKVVKNDGSAETSTETIFNYSQKGNILQSKYSGGDIVTGHLLGLVDDNGNIDMRYHQVNKKGEIKTGICRSVPEILDSGKIRLYEEWEWTCDSFGKGQSTLEEI